MQRFPLLSLTSANAMKILTRLYAMICGCCFISLTTLAQSPQPKEYQVGAYYFPNYHVDKRNEQQLGLGWTEWKLIKEAKPRFKGHYQPKVPLWGYTDEADPQIMAQKIEAASSHGITAFIFDWYYYDDGPFLETGLENGFMNASNHDKMKFALMWANHNWLDIFPATHGTPEKQLYAGKITPETWDRMTDYIIQKYFKNSSYWLIDGAPYFSIYDLGSFLDSFGSTESAAKAIETFRRKTVAAGFKDLNVNAVIWEKTILPGTKSIAQPDVLVKKLGFNSVTDYVWIHHIALKNFPVNKYDSVKMEYFKYAQEATDSLSVPYYPNVSMGWDPTPRTNQSEPWGNYGYPFTPIITGNTPQAFKEALLQAKTFMDKNSKGPKILTINSWNEWSEGSYIEPDTVYRLDYLDAIKSVFGKK